jgi:hypothetical protein
LDDSSGTNIATSSTTALYQQQGALPIILPNQQQIALLALEEAPIPNQPQQQVLMPPIQDQQQQVLLPLQGSPVLLPPIQPDQYGAVNQQQALLPIQGSPVLLPPFQTDQNGVVNQQQPVSFMDMLNGEIFDTSYLLIYYPADALISDLMVHFFCRSGTFAPPPGISCATTHPTPQRRRLPQHR